MGQRNSRRHHSQEPRIIAVPINSASTSLNGRRSASYNAQPSPGAGGKKRGSSSKTMSSPPNATATDQQQQRHQRHPFTIGVTAGSSSNNNGPAGPQRSNIASSSSRHHNQNHVITSTSSVGDVTDSVAITRAPSPSYQSQSNTKTLFNVRTPKATDKQVYVLQPPKSRKGRPSGRSEPTVLIKKPVRQVDLLTVDSAHKERLHKQNTLLMGASGVDYNDNEQQLQQQQQQDNMKLYWQSDAQKTNDHHYHDNHQPLDVAGPSTSPTQRRQPTDQRTHDVRVTQHQSDYDVNRRTDREVTATVSKKHHQPDYEATKSNNRSNHHESRTLQYQSDNDDVFRGSETISKQQRGRNRDATLTKQHGYHYHDGDDDDDDGDNRDNVTLAKQRRSREMRDATNQQQYQSDSEVSNNYSTRRRQDDVDGERLHRRSYSSRSHGKRPLSNRSGKDDNHGQNTFSYNGKMEFTPEDGKDAMKNGGGASDSDQYHHSGDHQQDGVEREREYKSLTLLPQNRNSSSLRHQQRSSHSETLERRRANDLQLGKATRGNASSPSSQPSPSSGFFSMSDTAQQQGQGLLATIDEVDASGGAGGNHSTRTRRHLQPLTLMTSSGDDDVIMARSPRQPLTSTSLAGPPPSSQQHVARAIGGGGGNTLQREPTRTQYQNQTMQRRDFDLQQQQQQQQIHRPSSIDGRYNSQSPQLQRRQQGQEQWSSNPSSPAPIYAMSRSLTNLATVTSSPPADNLDYGKSRSRPPGLVIAKPAPHAHSSSVSSSSRPATKPPLLVMSAADGRGRGSSSRSSRPASRSRERDHGPIVASPALIAAQPTSTMTRHQPSSHQQQQQLLMMQQQQPPYPSSSGTMARRTASGGRQRFSSDNLSVHSSLPYL